MNLYPKLPMSASLEELARELGPLSIEECRARRGMSHKEAIYSPTGGTKVSAADLERLAITLTETATRNGYPMESKKGPLQADKEWAADLHKAMGITAHEAADEGVWHFVCCILVPDLVRWRWGPTPAGKVSDHYVSFQRTGRNSFGRLWWRAEFLRTLDGSYDLLQELGEDEQVQLMERPHLVGHRALTIETASALKNHPKAIKATNRSELFREVQKRLYRMGAFIEFDALDRQTISDLVSESFEQSAAAM